jgi:hypothetical protein
MNTRSIRLDTQLPDIECETKFNINRIRAYKSTIERDVFCQECGIQDSLYDVHHIIPQRLYERYDLEQDNHDNLILLCKHCHSSYGQKLDDIVLDVFEKLIKIKFLSFGEAYIKYLKSQEKSFLKRKPGAPAQYFIDKEDLELFAENSIVDIKTACEILKMPMHIVKRFCRDYNLAFDISYEFENKKLNTKQCPCCNWSGAVKFSTHLLEKQDDVHKKFLEELKQKYVELKSCEKVATFYSKYNFTKTIIEDLLNELGILKKLKNKEYCCPVCKVELKYIIKHFNETKDVEHNEFYSKLKNMYFVDNKSMSLISKELNLEMNLIVGYLKQFI